MATGYATIDDIATELTAPTSETLFEAEESGASAKIKLSEISEYTEATRTVRLIREIVRDLDNDISAADTTVELPSGSAVQNGDRVLYGWHSGDGSHQFVLNPAAGWTLQYGNTALDATAQAQIGVGSGHLEAEADVDNSIWRILIHKDKGSATIGLATASSWGDASAVSAYLADWERNGEWVSLMGYAKLTATATDLSSGDCIVLNGLPYSVKDLNTGSSNIVLIGTCHVYSSFASNTNATGILHGYTSIPKTFWVFLQTVNGAVKTDDLIYFNMRYKIA